MNKFGYLLHWIGIFILGGFYDKGTNKDIDRVIWSFDEADKVIKTHTTNESYSQKMNEILKLTKI